MILEKMTAKDGCSIPLKTALMVPTNRYGHSERLSCITSKKDTAGTCSSCKKRTKMTPVIKQEGEKR